MVPRKSILLIIVSVVQIIFWLPYLSMPPWTLPTPWRIGRWVVWFSGTFDLGTATDFFPAVMMVAAGLLAAIVGFRQRLTSRFIDIVMLLEVLAIVTLLLMDIIGTVAGVRFWPVACLTLLPFQFALPLAGIYLVRRRRSLIQPCL